ncbi:MAG: hypothetical protein V4621_01735 [Pseudomonadota bacterium]
MTHIDFTHAANAVQATLNTEIVPENPTYWPTQANAALALANHLVMVDVLENLDAPTDDDNHTVLQQKMRACIIAILDTKHLTSDTLIKWGFDEDAVKQCDHRTRGPAPSPA